MAGYAHSEQNGCRMPGETKNHGALIPKGEGGLRQIFPEGGKQK